MSKPLIAITSDYKDVEPYMWHATPSPYIDAATQVSDVIPMIVPSIGDKLEVDSLLDRIDGLLVTGSRSNVHPSNYGQDPTEDHAPFDEARDATTLPLIKRAVERGIPVLAICRGIQELNVAFGGSITANFQKTRQIDGHGYPWEGTMDERFALAHGLQIDPNSCIADILRNEIVDDSVQVNSLHTQALDQLGQLVEVEAVSEDGTIEAVTIKDAPGFVVGVQWHPEYWAVEDQTSNTILRTFGDAARRYLAQKQSIPVAAE
ncbi:MAG: gamma-glutamyl-gamma-aminobutyrate hydrolase family protein [Rhizobiaceae bacterium]|nr:gamma-glutamyl-gamma-aminobutyrate hydrolase family protein [Rhizobiaceae bacterium]